MSDPDDALRAAELAELEAAQNTTDASIEKLCQRIGVSVGHVSFVYEVIEEGHWRASRMPFRYVASVAKRKHLASLKPRCPAKEVRFCDLSPANASEPEIEFSTFEDAYEDEYEDEYQPTWRDLKAYLPAGLKEHIPVSQEVT